MIRSYIICKCKPFPLSAHNYVWNFKEAWPLKMVGGNGARSLEYQRLALEKSLIFSGEPMSSTSDMELNDVLGKFIMKCRKKDKKNYPGKTLYEMIYCMQA